MHHGGIAASLEGELIVHAEKAELSQGNVRNIQRMQQPTHRVLAGALVLGKLVDIKNVTTGVALKFDGLGVAARHALGKLLRLQIDSTTIADRPMKLAQLAFGELGVRSRLLANIAGDAVSISELRLS